MAGPSACQQLRQLLKKALNVLQDEGVIYRKVKSQDEVYHVRTGRIKSSHFIVRISYRLILLLLPR